MRRSDMQFDTPGWDLGKAESERAGADVRRRRVAGSRCRRRDVPDDDDGGGGTRRGATLTRMQQKMLAGLQGARFRYINEQLYTTDGSAALRLFSEHPEMYAEYHRGFRTQVQLWPQSPVALLVARIRARYAADGKTAVRGEVADRGEIAIADLGCGDAQIATELQDVRGLRVQSFDLVAANDRVVACNMAQLPLSDASIDIAIFCLSLMGTDYVQFLAEASRVLRPRGLLWIVEVASRFRDRTARDFVALLGGLGFTRTAMRPGTYFHEFEFVKASEVVDGAAVSKVSNVLKPCLYKKR